MAGRRLSQRPVGEHHHAPPQRRRGLDGVVARRDGVDAAVERALGAGPDLGAGLREVGPVALDVAGLAAPRPPSAALVEAAARLVHLDGAEAAYSRRDSPRPTPKRRRPLATWSSSATLSATRSGSFHGMMIAAVPDVDAAVRAGDVGEHSVLSGQNE